MNPNQFRRLACAQKVTLDFCGCWPYYCGQRQNIVLIFHQYRFMALVRNITQNIVDHPSPSQNYSVNNSGNAHFLDIPVHLLGFDFLLTQASHNTTNLKATSGILVPQNRSSTNFIEHSNDIYNHEWSSFLRTIG